MGFNKKYISEQNIRSIADNNNYIDFYNYFVKSDAIISIDKFSSDIFNEISKYKIYNKKEIMKIMNKCKTKPIMEKKDIIYTIVTVVLVIVAILIIFKDVIFK